MNEEMGFADACIILRKWKDLKDFEIPTKREINDFVKAMLIVNTTRR